MGCSSGNRGMLEAEHWNQVPGRGMQERNDQGLRGPSLLMAKWRRPR